MPPIRMGMQKTRYFFSRLAILGLLTLAYFAAGKFGLSLAFFNPNATVIWPPTGIALAAFLILGDYVWISIFLGAFLVNVTTSGFVSSALAIAVGNTLEGLIGAHLVRRFARGTQAFSRARDVFIFATLAGLLSTAVGALIGTTSLVGTGLASAQDTLTIWLTWWLGDAGGSLVVAPALILWATDLRFRASASRAIEAALMLSLSILVALVVFGDRSSFALRNYPLEFILVPMIIWASYRFGPRGVATTILLLSGIAVVGTLQGFGPFAQSSPNESLLLLQSFLITIAITGLGLAALVSERREVEDELKAANQKLKQSLDERDEHNRKMILHNEMGGLLQSCSTFEEAYTIIGQLGQQLLPAETGILYIIDNSQNRVESVVRWGNPPPEPETFTLDDCWALRRGRIHLVKSSQNELELPCPHLKNHPPCSSLCIPMTAQGDAMGILHIRSELPSPEQPNQDESGLTSSKQQLAIAMADSMVLALANLKLRLFLREQSIRDPLTGLFNRRYLEETLEREFNRAVRLHRPVGVIMLDLDHFKNFNDSYGHEAGDVLLNKLGSFLKQHLRGGDIACRYGGEEFVLVLPEVSLENVRLRAEELREGIKQLHVEHRGKVLPTLSLSLGIAMFPEHGASIQRVLNAADGALYEAKHKGRDRIVIASLDAAEESTAS